MLSFKNENQGGLLCVVGYSDKALVTLRGSLLIQHRLIGGHNLVRAGRCMTMIHWFRPIYIVFFHPFVAVNYYVLYIYIFLYRHARMLQRFYEVSQKKMELFSTDRFREEMSQFALAPDAPRLSSSLFTISILFISTTCRPTFYSTFSMTMCWAITTTQRCCDSPTITATSQRYMLKEEHYATSSKAHDISR